MSGPPPKPRDQRVRRNKNEGTTSTSVVLPAGGDLEAACPPWAPEPVELKVHGATVVVPKPPTRLRKAAREAWAMFWLGPEASMLRPHHLPALRRLVKLYNDEDRLRARVEKKHKVVLPVAVGMDGDADEGEMPLEYHDRVQLLDGHLGIGSQGQIVQSPDFAALMKITERIQALEDRFAATPLAQFRVGWQAAAMHNEQARARENTALVEAAKEIAERHEAMLEQGGQ